MRAGISGLMLAMGLATATCAVADDGVYMGDGATVYPITSSQVQLASETVIITHGGPDESAPGSRRMSWRVDATLHFRNLGGPTTVQMGFPFGPLGGDIDWSNPRERDEYDPHFRTWVDGEETPTTLKQAEPDSGLLRLNREVVYAFPVDFAGKQVRTVRHTYRVGGSASSDGSGDFTYVLTTGALWAGRIDTATVRVIVPVGAAADMDIVCPHEHDARREGDQLVLEWRWRDLEPDFDLKIASLPRSLHEMPLDELADETTTQAVWESGTVRRVLRDERPDPCTARWYCNRILAEYGYPFRSPFVRAQFYAGGACHEDPAFSEAALTPRHRYFLDFLTAKEWPRE